MQLLAALVLLFVLLPWLEIVLLLAVADWLGFFPMIGIVLATGAAGAVLARHQGVSAWRSVRQALREGRLPSKELFDGVCILCAGLLLVTPGLLTDATGFFLLIPVGRTALRKIVFHGLRDNLHKGSLRVDFDSSSATRRQPHRDAARRGDVIDVNGETIDLTDVD